MNTTASAPEPLSADQPDESRVTLDNLPLVDRLFIDEHVPPAIVQAIARQLLADERIFVLFQLNASHNFVSADAETGKDEHVPLWTVVTGARLLLLAASSRGQTYCDSFDRHAVVEYHNGLARDEIRIADFTITTGMWEGKRKLFKEALALFPLPEYEKYLYLAGVHANSERYAEALRFLRMSLDIEPTIKAYLLQAHTYSRTGTPDKAIDVLQQACHFADPAAIIAEIQHLFADNLVMFLYLAVVCEKHQWWDHGLTIYRYLLQKTPDFDLYALKLGELSALKHDYARAARYYQAFIQQRTDTFATDSGDFLHWELADSKCFGADPDLIKAYFDLSVIYERELRDPQQALDCALALIRHAPFYLDGYPQLWRAYRQASVAEGAHEALPAVNLSMFLRAWQLLHPQNYARHIGPDAVPGAEPEAQAPTYRPLRDSEHRQLTHPGELEYWRKVQNWITNLVTSSDEEQGIEQYCEQVGPSNYPRLSRIIDRVAAFVGITPPRCFISRGKLGISVKNKEHPFIFIGSDHLQADNARYFSEPELVFMIASQAEHIKSGHVLITGTELWKSLGTASFDSFLVALQFLPAGSFIGRLTHHFATKGLKRVYKMTQYTTIQKVLKFVERHMGEGPADDYAAARSGDERDGDERDGDEGEAENEPDRDWSQADKAGASEAMLRDQLVDFARHAVYTADRVGVLACHNLCAACSAVFKLAGDAYDDLRAFEQDGLLALIRKQDKREKYIYVEYAKRLRELLRFVLSETYRQLHESLLLDPLMQPQAQPLLREYDGIVKKLALLEQSRQHDLLTQDEFFLKQRQVLEQAAGVSDDDVTLLRKHQHACQDGVFTYTELHAKIIRTLEQGAKP